MIMNTPRIMNTPSFLILCAGLLIGNLFGEERTLTAEQLAALEEAGGLPAAEPERPANLRLPLREAGVKTIRTTLSRRLPEDEGER